jgi:hypothetical protein
MFHVLNKFYYIQNFNTDLTGWIIVPVLARQHYIDKTPLDKLIYRKNV